MFIFEQLNVQLSEATSIISSWILSEHYDQDPVDVVLMDAMLETGESAREQACTFWDAQRQVWCPWLLGNRRKMSLCERRLLKREMKLI